MSYNLIIQFSETIISVKSLLSAPAERRHPPLPSPSFAISGQFEVMIFEYVQLRGVYWINEYTVCKACYNRIHHKYSSDQVYITSYPCQYNIYRIQLNFLLKPNRKRMQSKVQDVNPIPCVKQKMTETPLLSM